MTSDTPSHDPADHDQPLREFLTGMFATWIATRADRTRPTTQDIARARATAETTLRDLGLSPDAPAEQQLTLG